MQILSSLSRNVLNALALKTNRKIVLIESDDWGAIRMPSVSTYQTLVKKGIIPSSDPYLRYDCLESDSDLEALFEVLESVKDKNGNSAKITANCIMGNPDFEKIEADDFRTYHFEDVEHTFKKYPNHSRSFNLWFEGKANNIFIPQLHGREHVNVAMWMNNLRSSVNEYLLAFNFKTYAINSKIVESLSRFFPNDDMQSPEEIVREAANIFQQKFGYKSISFVAPNYSWDNKVEQVLAEENIRFIQGSKKQNKSNPDIDNKTSIYHYAGQRNLAGQMYLVRNCLFEPSVSEKLDYYDICLKQIENAFKWKTPAIICSHRLNYVSMLSQENRDINLVLLKKMLQKIKSKWPNVEFMSTDELATHIITKTL